MNDRVRKTKIKDALNPQKVKAIKALVRGLEGDESITERQINSATSILLVLQGEGGE